MREEGKEGGKEEGKEEGREGGREGSRKERGRGKVGVNGRWASLH